MVVCLYMLSLLLSVDFHISPRGSQDKIQPPMTLFKDPPVEDGWMDGLGGSEWTPGVMHLLLWELKVVTYTTEKLKMYQSSCSFWYFSFFLKTKYL